MSMNATRILLCIDDGARRRLFAAALAPSADVEVVGAGAADESGIRAAAARQPDVILVEAARPGLDGAKLVGRLRAVAPRAGLLAVALQDDRPRTVVARGLAADRYVDPDVATAGLLDVLLEFVHDRRAGRIAS
jgi:DNA-binding NarL/FixJ family response regulator